MSSQIDEMISAIRDDKKYIDEREKERDQRFKAATNQFIKQIKNEEEKMAKYDENLKHRNEIFNEEIREIFKRYELSSLRLTKSEQHLLKEYRAFYDYIQRMNITDPNILEKINQESEFLEILQNELRNDHNRTKPLIEYDLERNRYQGFQGIEQIRQKQKILQKEIFETKSAMAPQHVQTYDKVKQHINYLDNFLIQKNHYEIPAKINYQQTPYEVKKFSSGESEGYSNREKPKTNILNAYMLNSSSNKNIKQENSEIDSQEKIGFLGVQTNQK